LTIRLLLHDKLALSALNFPAAKAALHFLTDTQTAVSIAMLIDDCARPLISIRDR